RMCAIHQHAARAADRRGTEAGARAIGGADIERDTGDGDGGIGRSTRGDAEKTRGDGEGRGAAAHGDSFCMNVLSPHPNPPPSRGGDLELNSATANASPLAGEA